jgi:hypothetical protein
MKSSGRIGTQATFSVLSLAILINAVTSGGIERVFCSGFSWGLAFGMPERC